MVDLQLAKSTVKLHREFVQRFLRWLDDKPLTREALRQFLSQFNGKSTSTYANALKALKVFFRDFLGMPELVESFRFPKQTFKPKNIPSGEQLRRFYEALATPRDKALFLFYASTGLRRREALELTLDDVDFEKRMVKPKPHNGKTKRVWVTFFNEECASMLKAYLAKRVGKAKKSEKLFPMSKACERTLWHKARAETGIRITPQTLREWFCSEMARLGVNDSYIDAFCGRVPRSVLARHYLDYSPERLREVYEKAGLRVLEEA
ncbi:MAG: tyrosine-type recombinase/integrase [Candidatus Bathyarchaeia archaeon]